jgi:hypothetical protein
LSGSSLAGRRDVLPIYCYNPATRKKRWRSASRKRSRGMQ